MYITIGLTTPEVFGVCLFLPTHRLGSRHGRRRPTATRVHEITLNLFISVIKASLLGFRRALSQPRNRGPVAPLSPRLVLATASTPGGRQTTQVRPIRHALCQSDSAVPAAQFHNPLILLEGKLTCRRLECKQNFRQKCPQNRLRTAGLASGLQPKPSPSPNLMSRCNLNPLPTGVSCHGQ